MKKVLIVAGGSGGHLLPAQQLAQELEEKATVFFAGHGIDRSPFFVSSGYSYQSITAAPFRKTILGMARFFIKTTDGIRESVSLIRRFRPDIIVGFGSYHTFPLLLAAALMQKKMVIFESNCLLGKVNRFFAKRASVIASQFMLSRHLPRAQLVPLLPWNQPKIGKNKEEARKQLGLDLDRATFLVFGGSQGAHFLNQMIPNCLPENAQVIHLTGNDLTVAETKKRYSIPCVVKSYESNMHLLYSAADFAICRSGAATIAELITHEIPALLIPFPYASENHQMMNAEFMVKTVQGALLLKEKEAFEENIKNAIAQVQNHSADLKANLSLYCKSCENRKSLSQIILE